MRTWLRKRTEAVSALRTHGARWWWARRMRVADWSFAVFTLPFSGLMMVAGVGGDISLLSRFLPEDLGGVSGSWALQMLAGVGLLIFGVPTLLASVAMLWRRSRPTGLMLVGVLVLAVFANPIPLMVGLYSYPAHRGERGPLAVWFVLGLATMAFLYGQVMPALLMLTVLYLVMPLIAGLWIGTRRQLIDRLQERAERLEREQHMMAERAITAERTRIAREMHDVVAHRVSLMVLHAGGLEVSAAEPRTVEAAGLIRTTGREALSELRGILGVLRDEEVGPAPTAPQPILDDLDRLLAEWRGAGMRVRWVETSQVEAGQVETGQVEARAGGLLSLALQRTAFRIVQEGLTNAAKHATGAAVEVRLHRGTDRLEVEVANEPGAVPAQPPPRGGFGLTGLRERVALAGGELSAGECPDGGWRLRAILPKGEGDRAEVPEAAPHPAEVEEEGTDGDPYAPGR